MGLLVLNANTFVLTAATFRITIRSHDDEPGTADYVGSDGRELHVEGDDVARAATPVGDWYTVVTATDRPKAGWCTLLSVLIPPIGFHSPDWSPKPVSTVAVEVVQPAEIWLPPTQASSYTTIALSGHASVGQGSAAADGFSADAE